MNSDFKDLLRYLNDYKVKYLIIGGYAVSYYTEPRFTKDLDIWVEASEQNSKRLVKALDKFGAPVDNLDPLDFASPGVLYVFGISPNRIDILNRAKGSRFTTAWSNREIVKIDGIKMAFIGRRELKRLKKAAGRPQDLLDLEKL